MGGKKWASSQFLLIKIGSIFNLAHLMVTRRNHIDKNETYFVTFTCYRWLHLIEMTNTYDYFDKWFEYLKSKNAILLAHVIMPNHFHGIIHLNKNSSLTINKLVGNGKRFLAYEIVRRLKASNNYGVLSLLSKSVTAKARSIGKLNNVFQPSFDTTICETLEVLEQKVDYIHHNPVSGKWSLVPDWSLYPYSSAGYYEHGIENHMITDYRDIWT